MSEAKAIIVEVKVRLVDASGVDLLTTQGQASSREVSGRMPLAQKLAEEVVSGLGSGKRERRPTPATAPTPPPAAAPLPTGEGKGNGNGDGKGNGNGGGPPSPADGAGSGGQADESR